MWSVVAATSRHRILRFLWRQREDELADLKRQKNEYTKGMWNVNAVFMGGLAGAPNLKGENSSSHFLRTTVVFDAGWRWRVLPSVYSVCCRFLQIALCNQCVSCVFCGFYSLAYVLSKKKNRTTAWGRSLSQSVNFFDLRAQQTYDFVIFAARIEKDREDLLNISGLENGNDECRPKAPVLSRPSTKNTTLHDEENSLVRMLWSATLCFWKLSFGGGGRGKFVQQRSFSDQHWCNGTFGSTKSNGEGLDSVGDARLQQVGHDHQIQFWSFLQFASRCKYNFGFLLFPPHPRNSACDGKPLGVHARARVYVCVFHSNISITFFISSWHMR